MIWRFRSMQFFLPELETSRASMLREWESEERTAPYRGSQLTDLGRARFYGFMRSAIVEGSEQSLFEDLRDWSYWQAYGTRPDRYGRLQTYTVNYEDAARRLAITEFNTAYVRGLSRRLLDEGVTEVEVYRAASAFQPRDECLTHEGRRYPTQTIYDGHRARYHPVPRPGALSIPTGPNCHHSIRRVG